MGILSPSKISRISLIQFISVCVIFVTFFDTCFVTLVALIVWRIPPYYVFLPWLFFATHDGLYLTSALNKVPDGAWFTLTLAAVLASIFMLWRFGKESQWNAEAEDRFRPNQLIKKGADDKLSLTTRWGGGTVTPIRGFGIYFDKTGVLTPTVYVFDIPFMSLNYFFSNLPQPLNYAKDVAT